MWKWNPRQSDTKISYIVSEKLNHSVIIFALYICKWRLAYLWRNSYKHEGQYCLTLRASHGPLCPWDSPGKNTGVGCRALLQGIFPTQGSNPGLSHCRWILYRLSHQWSPRGLEWVAHPFSRGSSQPSNPSRVSCIVGGFITSWATREVQSWGLAHPHLQPQLSSQCSYQF